MDILFVLGRILFGGFFMMSGINHFKHMNMMAPYAASKGIPMPKTLVGLSGLMILLGGLGIVFGIYVQISVLLISLFLFVVSFKMHDFWTVTDPGEKMAQSTNFKKNMALLGAALMMLMIQTPWAWALF